MIPENSTKNNMTSDYGYGKADKSKELNASMTITASPADELTRKIKNIKGGEN